MCNVFIEKWKENISNGIYWTDYKSGEENKEAIQTAFLNIYNKTVSALDAQRKADARMELGKVIDGMKSEKEFLGSMGDTENYKTINAAITAAQAVYDKSDATVEDIKEATSTAQAARYKVEDVINIWNKEK